MTEAQYLYDSYQKESEATIQQISQLADGQTYLVLDKTIFFAQGGGQPSDTGHIAGPGGKLVVKSVEYNKGDIKHVGKLTGTLKVGDKVKLEIDEEKRHQHMTWHSAGHLLDDAALIVNPKLVPVSGMHGIGGKMYIEYSGQISEPENFLEQINIELVKLQKNHQEIITKFVTLEELRKLSDWIPENLPKNKKLRIMQIGSGRVIPDGGTQVKNTSEIPSIMATKIETGDGSFKVHYQVGSYQERPIIKSKEKSTPVKSNNLIAIKTKFKIDVEQTNDLKQYAELQTKYLGKKGAINQLFDSLTKEEKSRQGKEINLVKKEIEEKLDQKKRSRQTDLEKETFDVTVPGILPPVGHLHLITQAIKEVTDIFTRIGFVRRRYPEVDIDWYAAEGLNIPKDHPARDDQETFYVSDNVVLTPHTSNGQLREMEYLKKPPIRMINIGKTYRRQIDVSHTPMFHQFEGLMIDKLINITHLIGVGNYFVKEYFGANRRIRLRPHHFQFTEPSFEVDITCDICKGKGCRLCKAGWLELGGAGMVHPVVLKNGGLDPSKYSGFAFGWGVERVLAMKYGISDIRDVYTTDLRILNQF